MTTIQSPLNTKIQQQYKSHINLYNQGYSTSKISSYTFYKTCIKYCRD